MSGLKNDFPPKVKQFWRFEHPYSYCGRNGVVDIHHIKKRISNSIFNSIPITRKEHDSGGKHTPEREAFFIQWTVAFVMRVLDNAPNAYKLRDADMNFIYVAFRQGIIPQNQYTFFIHLNQKQV